jgi:transglutaminase-like putative cysteine protease
MSGGPLLAERPPVTDRSPRDGDGLARWAIPADDASEGRSNAWPVAARIGAFAALGLFAAGHWSILVEEPPAGRVPLIVLVATTGAVALLLTARMRPGRAATAARVAIAAATLLVALLAAGLQARLLLPGHWDSLADGLDRGLSGVRTASYPYSDTDGWVRLTILLLPPLVLSAAAALAFWPGRRRAARDTAALALVVAMFGIALATRRLDAETGRGLALLVLIGAWLWLPGMRRAHATAAAAAVALAGLLAIPLSGRIDDGTALLDYRSWGLWSPDRSGATVFDWSHNYGPMNWRRDGRTVLNVRSSEPMYWKSETLDTFDGFRWVHTARRVRQAPGSELPPPPLEPRWLRRMGVTVRDLRSDTVIGAGTIRDVDGADPIALQADGTARLLGGEVLEEGDTYTVLAYVPDPSAARMRAAGTPPETMRGYTEILLPTPDQVSLEGSGSRSDVLRSHAGAPLPVSVGVAGDARQPELEVERGILDSPYARTYRLARRLAAGQKTDYDVARNVERWLERELRYSEEPPRRALPLQDFLFRDRRGYCQQFSGAMALMLRMNGVPARIGAGFAPGLRDAESGEFRVRDLDAHSWVEVYFDGIGWVPFDPTPSRAPAELQAGDRGGASAGGESRFERERPGEPTQPSLSERGTDDPGDGVDEGSPLAVLAVLLGLGLVGSGALWARGWLRGRPRGPDAEVEELRIALERLGHPVPAATTLSGLERRLERLAGRAAARYVRALRARRFLPPGGEPALDRRALRRALTARRGALARLRAVAALPPRAPDRLRRAVGAVRRGRTAGG